jgi:hypothetical protein
MPKAYIAVQKARHVIIGQHLRALSRQTMGTEKDQLPNHVEDL